MHLFFKFERNSYIRCAGLTSMDASKVHTIWYCCFMRNCPPLQLQIILELCWLLHRSNIKPNGLFFQSLCAVKMDCVFFTNIPFQKKIFYNQRIERWSQILSKKKTTGMSIFTKFHYSFHQKFIFNIIDLK